MTPDGFELASQHPSCSTVCAYVRIVFIVYKCTKNTYTYTRILRASCHMHPGNYSGILQIHPRPPNVAFGVVQLYLYVSHIFNVSTTYGYRAKSSIKNYGAISNISSCSFSSSYRPIEAFVLPCTACLLQIP